jgi:murein DD-endopeptidase MepM/ murein hydrolase activator NlpD
VAGTEPERLRPSRRFLLAAAPALALAQGVLRTHAFAQSSFDPLFTLSGKLVQSGYVIGRTRPRARILVNDEPVGEAAADGAFIVGFDRDEPNRCGITVQTDDAEATRHMNIAPVDYDLQKIDGLPQDQVTPTDPALLARIAAEARRKAVGFASDIDFDGFKGGFALPLPEGSFRQSARFGGQRILNGVPERPHYGSDLAAPVGTPVTAPADGQVSFAETGLHYEGALILIDHGQGLVSAYLHLSKVGVAAGQKVKRGEPIGAVGKEGRATGPHLCWRMKWRGRNMDPMRMVGTPQPV